MVRDTLADTPLPTEAELAALARSEGPSSGRLRDTSGSQWLYAARDFSGRAKLVVLTPRPRLRALSLLGADLLRPLVQAGLVALFFSLILAWLISRWVAAPLQKMSRAAREVAQGRYESQPEPDGPEEVKSLAVAFSNMVRQVQSSQKSQRDFVANVSHELKTPLTSIQGFAQAILDGTAEAPAEREHAAQVIYDESNRLRRLVEDLLDLARLDAGQIDFAREPVDLEALLGSVADRQRLLAEEKGVQLQNEVEGLPHIVGDGDRLAQVFTNLLDNAIKHTPRGGGVTLSSHVAGGRVEIHVDDMGPGIPEKERSRIFERFYQLDKARAAGQSRGVGLGLTISHEIIQAHGGSMGVESGAGGGSRFSVRLPVALAEDVTLARGRI